jgi:hypothetical protein
MKGIEGACYWLLAVKKLLPVNQGGAGNQKIKPPLSWQFQN